MNRQLKGAGGSLTFTKHCQQEETNSKANSESTQKKKKIIIEDYACRYTE